MKVKTAAKGKDTTPEKINLLNKNGAGGNIFLRALLSILNASVCVLRAIRRLICYVPKRVRKLIFKICVWYTKERANAAAKSATKAAGKAFMTVVGRPSQEEESSKSSEILKSIVYGGLQTIIISLCMVAFLAAFDAPAMIVERFAIACVIGGIFFFVYNIWEFKRSCNNGISSHETKKYKEQLGRVNYFPMHASFAILSFIVFGMIPPVSFLFLETINSKDLNMALVEVVSLLSVALLAIFKVSAIDYKDYFQHVINLAYYLAYAVSRSVCSYLAGYVAKKLMGELGFKFY